VIVVNYNSIMDLIGLTQIAEMLGMTRQGADRLVKREPMFPVPVTVLTGRTRVWEREAVERWMQIDSPKAHLEYLTWILRRIPAGATGGALRRYRMLLKIGISAALGSKKLGPTTMMDAYERALAGAREIQADFQFQPPSSIEDWALETGRITVENTHLNEGSRPATKPSIEIPIDAKTRPDLFSRHR
jgi:predicted DNA-binding transcriptional regulator AlpA